jgi:hypothetical protein
MGDIAGQTILFLGQFSRANSHGVYPPGSAAADRKFVIRSIASAERRAMAKGRSRHDLLDSSNSSFLRAPFTCYFGVCSAVNPMVAECP